MTYRRILIAALVAGLPLGASAWAQDELPSMARTVRLSPSTLIEPAPREDVAATEDAAVEEDVALLADEVPAEDTAPVTLTGPEEDTTEEDTAEEDKGVEESEPYVLEEPEVDVSDVEMFDPEALTPPEESDAPAKGDAVPPPLDDWTFDSETQSARVQPEAPVEQGPPPRFSSTAFPGYYEGVGAARGMVLVVVMQGSEISGRFTDSAGHEFMVHGEVINPDGQARLAVLGEAPVGVLQLQLTNLGLTSVFIPLTQDMQPDTGAVRNYEFLRALSPDATRALEELRQANEARREAALRALEERNTGPVRLVFPGDDDW